MTSVTEPRPILWLIFVPLGIYTVLSVGAMLSWEALPKRPDWMNRARAWSRYQLRLQKAAGRPDLGALGLHLVLARPAGILAALGIFMATAK